MARGLARTRKLKKQMKERKKKDYWMGKSEEDDVSPPPVAVAYLASTLLPSPRAAPPRPAGPRLLKRVHVYLAALILTIPYLILRGPRCPEELMKAGLCDDAQYPIPGEGYKSGMSDVNTFYTPPFEQRYYPYFVR